jgi:hypothetical protein
MKFYITALDTSGSVTLRRGEVTTRADQNLLPTRRRLASKKLASPISKFTKPALCVMRRKKTREW